ncbi:SUMF1/EgtB/PvdO family nonheme iron enzyme [Polynucleobacter necessarius]|uniref:SUMF1/EgtB/PvdO family nonheme iron enzyme n=1 Tax=Polynucleobacter necessarius TaxID=576610 RepID=UPI000E09BF68|nr:SUMF1/EgtB/PvdO family nonheme iron enzyme [Polynucleobacter necessarius]
MLLKRKVVDLSYESGFVQKPGWTWRTPYGVPAQDGEPAVHLNQKEAESICRYFGKRLPIDAEWTNAAFLEQRVKPPVGYVQGQPLTPILVTALQLFRTALVGCGDYKGLAPAGALNRGTGHVMTGSTRPGANGMHDMGGNVWE